MIAGQWGKPSEVLLDLVVESGRQIIGFDLVEVSGNAEWDAIVGARLLLRLCLLAAQSHPRV